MENRELRFIDKSTWGVGLWQGEPDKTQWQDEATGLPCLAVRNKFLGHWCGYVGVAEGHALFATGYTSCPRRCAEDYCDHTPESSLSVHGGITFSDFCQESDAETGICHVPAPGEPERVFWFGFDCAHCDDLCPGMLAETQGARRALLIGNTYRTLDYVRDECARLARQLAEQVGPAAMGRLIAVDADV